MRDSKDHTTLELPGFELADLVSTNLSKKKALANPAVHAVIVATTGDSKLSRKTRTICQNQLELLAPLGQTDQSGLPAWIQDEGLDQSGLPIWGLLPSENNANIVNS